MVPERSRPGRPAAGALPTLLGLAALGAVQPVLDLLARHAAFLTVHGLQGLTLLLLPVALTAGVGLAAWLPAAIARRLWPRAAGPVFGVTAGTLLAIGLRPPLARLLAGSDGVAAASAAVLAAVLVFLAARSPRLRRGLPLLAWAAPLVVAAFLLAPGVRPLLLPARAATGAGDAPPPDADTPVIIVVLDAFPLAGLLDRDGGIDPIAYPHLAALAGDAVWYRGALGVSDDTILAVPAILTGREPRRGAAPTRQAHPDNLFTWLAPSRPVHAFESHTRMAPGGGSGAAAAWRLLAADLAVVAGRVLLPAALARRLPAVEGRWKGFAGGDESDIDPGNRDRLLAGFLESLARDEENSCWFLHLLLPHPPYVHYPSGRAFAHGSAEPGGQGRQSGPWTRDLPTVLQSQQRFLLQAEWTDACAGRVIDVLKRRGLYDRALVVVTADHGTAFTPGAARRTLTDANAGEILPVPLLIKPPRIGAGRRDDGPARSTDILPTVAGLLGTRLPWPHGGRDLNAPAQAAPPETLTITAATADVTVARAAVAAQRERAVAAKLARFGAAPGLPGMFAPRRGVALLGTEPTVQPPVSGWRLVLEGPAERSANAGGPLPGEVRGLAVGSGTWPEDWDVAVAVDGRVAAVTHPRRSDTADGLAPWATLLPESALTPGDHRVAALLVQWRGDEAACRAAGADGLDVLDADLVRAELPGLVRSGFTAPVDGDGPDGRFRGAATVSLRSVGAAAPGSVELDVAAAAPGDAVLVVAANGAPVGVVTPGAGRWHGRLDLAAVNCLDGLDLDFYALEPGGGPAVLDLGQVRLRAGGDGDGPLQPLPATEDLYPHAAGAWRLTGFHRAEPWGKGIAAWTDGDARAEFDLAQPARPRFLLIDLASTGRAGTTLTAAVDGRTALARDLPAGPWRGCGVVPEGTATDRLTVDLTCPPFVPAERDGESTDTRRLGVAVRGVHVVLAGTDR